MVYRSVKIQIKPNGSKCIRINENNAFIYVLNTLNRIMPATWSRQFYSRFFSFFLKMSLICALHTWVVRFGQCSVFGCWQPIFVVLTSVCIDLFPIFVSIIEFCTCQILASIVPYERLCLSSPHDWPVKGNRIYKNVKQLLRNRNEI